MFRVFGWVEAAPEPPAPGSAAEHLSAIDIYRKKRPVKINKASVLCVEVSKLKVLLEMQEKKIVSLTQQRDYFVGQYQHLIEYGFPPDSSLLGIDTYMPVIAPKGPSGRQQTVHDRDYTTLGLQHRNEALEQKLKAALSACNVDTGSKPSDTIHPHRIPQAYSVPETKRNAHPIPPIPPTKPTSRVSRCPLYSQLAKPTVPKTSANPVNHDSPGTDLSKEKKGYVVVSRRFTDGEVTSLLRDHVGTELSSPPSSEQHFLGRLNSSVADKARNETTAADDHSGEESGAKGEEGIASVKEASSNGSKTWDSGNLVAPSTRDDNGMATSSNLEVSSGGAIIAVADRENGAAGKAIPPLVDRLSSSSSDESQVLGSILHRSNASGSSVAGSGMAVDSQVENYTGGKTGEEDAIAGPVDCAKTANTEGGIEIAVAREKNDHATVAESSNIEVGETKAAARYERLSSSPDAQRQVLGFLLNRSTISGCATAGNEMVMSSQTKSGGTARDEQGKAGTVDGAKSSNTEAGNEMDVDVDVYAGNQTGRKAREKRGKVGPFDGWKNLNPDSLVAIYKDSANLAASSKPKVSGGAIVAVADHEHERAGSAMPPFVHHYLSSSSGKNQIPGSLSNRSNALGSANAGDEMNVDVYAGCQIGIKAIGERDNGVVATSSRIEISFGDTDAAADSQADSASRSVLRPHVPLSSSDVNRQVLGLIPHHSSKAGAANINNEIPLSGRAGDQGGGKGKGKERNLEAGHRGSIGGEAKGRGDKRAKGKDKAIVGDSDDDLYPSDVAHGYEASVDSFYGYRYYESVRYKERYGGDSSGKGNGENRADESDEDYYGIPAGWAETVAMSYGAMYRAERKARKALAASQTSHPSTSKPKKAGFLQSFGFGSTIKLPRA